MSSEFRNELANFLDELNRRLDHALAEFMFDAKARSHATRCLIRPPLALGQTISGDLETDKLAKTLRRFDGDTAASLLRLHEGQPEPGIRWKMLSRAEKARAKRLWNWIGKTHRVKGSSPQGRPLVMDTALVLYCMCILSEYSFRKRFRYRRPMNGGAPGGPMWRALIAALPLAQFYLALRFGTTVNIPDEIDGPIGQLCDSLKNVVDVVTVTRATGKHAANIADIVKLSRSKQFEKCCRSLDLRLDSNDVALKPPMYRYAIFLTRKVLTAAQRSRAARKMRLPTTFCPELPPAHGRIDRQEIDESVRPPALVITPEMLPDKAPFWSVQAQLKEAWHREMRRHSKNHSKNHFTPEQIIGIFEKEHEAAAVAEELYRQALGKIIAPAL
jgi:hypothetical protein